MNPHIHGIRLKPTVAIQHKSRWKCSAKSMLKLENLALLDFSMECQHQHMDNNEFQNWITGKYHVCQSGKSSYIGELIGAMTISANNGSYSWYNTSTWVDFICGVPTWWVHNLICLPRICQMLWKCLPHIPMVNQIRYDNQIYWKPRKINELWCASTPSSPGEANLLGNFFYDRWKIINQGNWLKVGRKEARGKQRKKKSENENAPWERAWIHWNLMRLPKE